MHLFHLPFDVKGAILDLDGTLLDSMPYWENLGENYLIARGKTPAPDIRFHFKRLTLDQSAEYMKREYDLDETPAEIARGVMDGIVHQYHHVVPLCPGVLEFLDALQAGGVEMCVATASERELMGPALERLGVMHYFKAVLSCAEVGASKTDPLIFNLALEALGTPRGQTVVLDDSLHAIETAKAAGFPTVGVLEPSSAEDHGEIKKLADATVTTFADVAQWL